MEGTAHPFTGNKQPPKPVMNKGLNIQKDPVMQKKTNPGKLERTLSGNFVLSQRRRNSGKHKRPCVSLYVMFIRYMGSQNPPETSAESDLQVTAMGPSVEKLIPHLVGLFSLETLKLTPPPTQSLLAPNCGRAPSAVQLPLMETQRHV